jgi:hypothetical protein
MPNRFRTQSEYYLRLAQAADAPEDKAQLASVGCAWHRLGQELDLRDEINHRRPSMAAGVGLVLPL